MIKTQITAISFFFISFIAISLQGQTSVGFLHPSLKKIWSSEKRLATPESVIYNEKSDVLYVSNINGMPTEKDGNGFISIMSTDGKILNLKWINGLNAPKGMGIFNGKLYVTDINQLIEIDIEQSKIINKYEDKKAHFLNDIAIDQNGIVYVSDTKKNVIFMLKDGKFEVWLRIGNLFQPNGLLIYNDKLLIGCMNYVVSVDKQTKHVRSYITETGSIDGLVKNGKEQFIISDWTGNIYLINTTNPKLKLLSTEAEKINAADIEYIKSKKLLLVPTFFDNRVEAYELNL